MAKKVSAPAPAKPEAPETEAPKAPDMAPLLESIAPYLEGLKEGEAAIAEARLNIAVECRSFREENPEVERTAIKLAIQTVVAETYGLKIEHVQSKPEDKLKQSKPADYAVRNSCYTLVSELLGIAWAKDEKHDAKVGKLIEGGETRWVVLKKAAQKSQSNPSRDPNANKITKDTFATQFNLFLTKAQTDMGTTLESIYEMAEAALEAMKAAPQS